MAVHSSARSAYSPAWRSSSMLRLCAGNARSWLHSSRVLSCSRASSQWRCSLPGVQLCTRLQRGDVSLLVRVGRLAEQVLLNAKRLLHVSSHRGWLVLSARAALRQAFEWFKARGDAPNIERER